ncbi:inositol monophosphatase family protein [Actinoplanes derwentensis]|uniref:inositol monophosphatase family protein n=1 Tax=Actinoplanes derwentensis TaxID=113562 RepID=UPI000B8495A3|nr:inositol monophosphatase family protein [Actinoplanes derwentensis]GID88380.1 hypothetical protein Ade03nite_73040 [Actinoplanes derwentensis]
MSNELLEQVTAVVRRAGEALLDGYAESARPANKAEMATVGRQLEKTDVDAAIVTMTQPRTRNRRLGDAATNLLDTVLFIRSTVPSTFPLLDLAGGHVDAYWQYECDLIGVAAGVLLVTEAGGVVTDLTGEPWRPGHTDILAAAPGLHRELLAVLQAEGAH